MLDIDDIRKKLKTANLELVYKVTGVHPHTLRRIRDSKDDAMVIYKPTLTKLEEYFNDK